MSVSLTYFGFDGSRGLECRLALCLAGIDFDDVHVGGPSFRALKPSLPFGSLPMLEIDGRRLVQSNAILNYLGRTHGLSPADPWTQAQHEAVMLSVEDFRYKVEVDRDATEEARKAKREAFVAGWMTQWASSVDAMIAGPFLAGERPCVADLKLYVICRSVKQGVYDYVPDDVLETWPRLVALHDAVDAHPAVRGWLDRA